MYSTARCTFPDSRYDYEARYITLGFLGEQTVSIAHTEKQDEIRIISFRKATRIEERLFRDRLSDGLGENTKDARRGHRPRRCTPRGN
ncbi:BrnT family toxin [Pseudoduganella sp. LjRoot289]|uniref:BrnT family toxin n=1 Tax=Pseudoduganella sp. LjRoot289 TaxID=3342314 RepID=UPI003F4FED82